MSWRLRKSAISAAMNAAAEGGYLAVVLLFSALLGISRGFFQSEQGELR